MVEVNKDENGDPIRKEDGTLDLIKHEVKDGASYEATAEVFIKEYSTGLSFDKAGIKAELNRGDSNYSALLKHSVDFNKYLVREPKTSNDTITWISTDTKLATVTAAGVVTFKKVGNGGSIIAVGERGVKAVYEFDVAQGQAASRIEIVDDEDAPLKSITRNLEGDGTDECDESDEFSVGVNMYAKIKGAIVSNKDSKKAATKPEEFKRNNKDEVVTGNVEVKDGDEYFFASEDKKDGVSQGALYITDAVTWNSNKQAIATVKGDSEGATVTALSVGKAVITAKSSAGKSSKLNVTVTAILTDLEIGNVPENGLYSGQTVTLVALKTPRANNDAVTWAIAKEPDGKKNPNATINAKGELKIKPMLDVSNPEYQTIEVTLTSKKKYDVFDADGNKTGSENIVAEPAVIVLEQSSVDEIYVKEGNEIFASAVAEYKDGKFKKINKNKNLDGSNVREINVPKGKTFDIVANATPGTIYGGTDTLSFKSSSTKVATIDPAKDGSKLTVTAVAKGSSTVTVSGVRVNGTKASTISTTFKVNVVQPVMTLTMNKPVVTINEKLKSNAPTNQAVSLKVTLGPKGVNTKEAITWEVKQTKDKGVKVANAEYESAKDAKGKDLTKASASVNLPTPEVGDQFVIKASTKSGATATATVNVVTKTTAVAIAEKTGLKADGNKQIPYTFNKNTRDAKIGETFTIYPYVNVGTAKAPDWQAAGASAAVEDVTYSVNKKGIVTVEADGTVHVLNKGTVTITAKTPQGKKGTLKVVVKDLSLYEK